MIRYLLLAAKLSPALMLLYYVLRWIVKWMFAIYQTTRDVTEIKENHLKHIYKALKLICEKLDINMDSEG